MAWRDPSVEHPEGREEGRTMILSFLFLASLGCPTTRFSVLTCDQSGANEVKPHLEALPVEILQILGQILNNERRNNVKLNSLLENRAVKHKLKNLRNPNIVSIALDPHLHKLGV